MHEDRGVVDSLNRFYNEAFAHALDLGLCPSAVEFELVPATAIFELASYGLPGHWHHWTYGREYWLIKQRMEQGSGRLYELVINADPARAYLLESNSLASQKLVMVHVLGHCDLFRNHERFQWTPKDMDRSMASAQERFQHYAEEYGADRVEVCLDRALSLRDQVAPDRASKEPGTLAPDPFRDLFERPSRRMPLREARSDRYHLPTADVLGFLIRHSSALEEWERDVLETVRREALYLEPQRLTKVVHEGYATWVHHRLLDSLALSQSEMLEASRIHAQVVAPHTLELNPYRLGWKLMCYLADNLGFDRMRAIVLQETDSSLIRNWFDEGAAEALEVYRYRWEPGRHILGTNPVSTWDAIVMTSSPEEIRDWLANRLAYRGPEIVVEAVDSTEGLILAHRPDELDLDEAWAQSTLNQVAELWGGPVVLRRGQSSPLRAVPGGRDGS